MKYARHDIVLQREGANEDLLIRIDNSEASGAIPLVLLSHDEKEKVSGYMNFQGAKALGYNLSNKELLDELSFLVFNTRSDSGCSSYDEFELGDLKVLVFHPTDPEEIPEDMRETTSVSEIFPNCVWCKFPDGSGHLDGPRKGQKLIESYDLDTGEFKYRGEWYFFADGIAPFPFGHQISTQEAISQMEAILYKTPDTFVRLYISWYGSCNEDALEAAAETGGNADELALQKFLATAKEEELVGYMLYSTGGCQYDMLEFLMTGLPGVSGKKKENIRKILKKMYA